MVKSRIIGTVCLVFSLLFYILSDSYFALLLLVMTIVLGFFLSAYMMYIKNKVQITLHTSGSVIKNERGSLFIKVKNKTIVPIAKVKCSLHIHNHITGETHHDVFDVAVNGKTTESITFNLESKHCGKIDIMLEEVQFYDFLGIFSALVEGRERTDLYVLPESFPIAVNSIYRKLDEREHDFESQFKGIANHGELTGIKEYAVGDNLKQVHWKLTSKFDEMIVKELSESTDHSLLILFETSIVDEREKDDPDMADAVMEAYISVSHSLIDNEQVHRIGWFDHEIKKIQIEDISSHDQITQLLPTLLTLTKQPDTSSTMDYYRQMVEPDPISHIIYVTSEQAADFIREWDLSSEITVLKCEPSVEKEYVSDATAVGFTPETMKDRLRELR